MWILEPADLRASVHLAVVRGGLLVVCLAGCAVPEPPPHVVLVTLDTTRADRIGAYGYPHARTAALDELASTGRVYRRAYSPVPLTIPAHAALLTGRYPARLGIRENGDASLAESELTLAEILHQSGYATAASVAAFVTSRQWGLAQGFDAYFDELPDPVHDMWHAERPGGEVVDDALGWKACQPRRQPVFLWVHLYDAHFPYQPPVGWEGARPYDGEIAYADYQLGRVVEAFRGEPTLFVVAGDHGEGLGDHGELTHGLFTYEAAQRVPLVVAGPGVEPASVDEPVSLVDVLPTVLHLLGQDPPVGVDGRVVPSGRARPLYMESYQLHTRFGLAPHLAVVDGQHKLIHLPRPELYDVVSDPAEEHDLSGSHPDEVARLQAELAGFGFQAPSPSPPDARTALQLEALGYTVGAGDSAAPAVDPKDHRRLIGLSQRAEHLARTGAVEEAEAVLAGLVQEHPELVELASRRAALLGKLGRSEEAIPVLEELVERHPGREELRFALAGHLAQVGRSSEAAELYRGAAERAPSLPRVRALAVATTAGSDPEGALALGLAYLDEHPDDPALAGVVGVELARRGDLHRAVPLLRAGAATPRPEPDVALTLATVEAARGRPDGAEALLRRELAHYPGNVLAVLELCHLLAIGQDWQGQLAAVDAALEVETGHPLLWHARAQALFNLERFAEARVALDQGLRLDPRDARLILLDANLLAREGHRARGEARYQEARAALERELSGGEAAPP